MTQQELKMLCQQKLQQSQFDGNMKQIETFTIIDKILTQENAIRLLGVEISMNILYDLGFSKKQAQTIYLEFIK